MKPSKLVVAALAAACSVACAVALAPACAQAAEPSGPVTPAVPNTCPAAAMTSASVVAIPGEPAAADPAAAADNIALPPALQLPVSLASDISAANVCGPCSQPVCVGKTLNSFCFGFIRLCQQVSLCAAATVPKCECLSPP